MRVTVRRPPLTVFAMHPFPWRWGLVDNGVLVASAAGEAGGAVSAIVAADNTIVADFGDAGTLLEELWEMYLYVIASMARTWYGSITDMYDDTIYEDWLPEIMHEHPIPFRMLYLDTGSAAYIFDRDSDHLADDWEWEQPVALVIAMCEFSVFAEDILYRKHRGLL
jgi:hypothetical protein